MAGRGYAVATGLAFDLAPNARGFGLSLGARGEMDWLSYELADSTGATYDHADVTALTIYGTATAYVPVSQPLCFILDVAVGAPLRTVAIRENNETQSALRGVALASALGLAAQF